MAVLACPGEAWLGSVRFGPVRRGKAVVARHGLVFVSGHVWAWLSRLGPARLGVGTACPG